jgi:adenylate cyclase
MGLAAQALRRGGAVLVAILVIGLVLWRWSGVEPVSARMEGALLDLRFRLRGPLPPPESVVIVAVDEPALDRIGAYEPLRAALAESLAKIAAAGPRVIGIDILLVDRTGADAALASAIRKAGPVLLAAGITAAHDGPGNVTAAQEAALTRSALPVVIGRPAAPREPARLVLPNPRLVAEGLLAHVNVAPDEGGAARAIPLAVPVGEDRLLPSMALSAARFGLDAGRGDLVHWAGGAYRIDRRMVVPDERGRLVLDHYGGPGTIPTVGLLEVLDGAAGAEALAGRVVLIGSTAPSLRDAFATPFGAAVAGVEILATATANIVEGRTIRADRGTFALTALLGLGAASATLAAFRIPRMALALAAAVGCWLAALGALQAAFAWGGFWLDGLSVLGGLAVATAVGGWGRLRHESRGRENLAHYVAPSLVRLLSEQARPGFDGREQAVGILFVDVAGYSGMVETEPPAEIADFLRGLHAFFEGAAERHGGVIVDFQGDGALLVFGLPDPRPEDAASALACGATLLAGRASVRAAFARRPIELRVSVHWGPVAIGVLGGRRHAKVSVSGDAVNVTARLQEIAKEHGVPFVATRAALDAAGVTGRERGFRPLATEPLRGRRGDVEIWGWSEGGSRLDSSAANSRGGRATS